MNITVLGGAGFLGSHIADAATAAGHSVTIFDCVESPFVLPGQRMVVGDIMNPDDLGTVLQEQDVVYHCAGIADIDDASQRPVDTVRFNVLGTALVLEACAEMNVGRLVFASTVYVYSTSGSFYRVSKQSCELLVEEFHESHGLEYTIVRYGSLYGPRSDERNGVYRFLIQAVRDGEIAYSGNGEEVRDYLHVLDAARLSLEILEPKYANERVVLTGNQTLKGHDLLTMIKEIVNRDVDVVMRESESANHYQITPYRFAPRLGRKLVNTDYVDMGHGLLQLVSEIFQQVNEEKLDQRLGTYTR